LIVQGDDTQTITCSQSRGSPVSFKTTITRTLLPSVPDFNSVSSWEGRVEATGGQTGKYLFFFPNPNDAPRQLVPSSGGLRVISIGVGTGKIFLFSVSSGNFYLFQGVWLFDIQATELLSTSTPGSTCDIRAVSLSIGTSQVAGVEDSANVISRAPIPEGTYQAECPSRPYLVLNPPVPVRSFIQGKNIYLQGNPGLPLRPDLGGINVSTGIVTSVNPGTVNPVRVVGIGVETPSPSYYHLDWLRSNPVNFFRDIVDRFDPVPVVPNAPLPPGSPPLPQIDGASIDDMIVPGKRIRPLWPV
jgi:hypothetical protein